MKQSKGLGDSIHKFTKITGIKTLTELASKKITGKPGGCGCNKRKEWLNNQFPYKQK